MKFEGKNVVITGGCGGIGLALARELLNNGVKKLALLDLKSCDTIDMNRLHSDFPKQEIFVELTDVSDKSRLKSCFEKVKLLLQSIDCVVACAGVLNEQNYELTMAVNLLGLIETNYEGIRYMSKEQGGNGGLIVNISSVAGIDCSQFSSPVYNASKHGVVAFTRSLGDDFYYQKYGIKFLTICPGVTITKFLDDLTDKLHSPEAFESSSKKLQHALTQTAEEFAVAFVNVCGLDKNGTVWLIDGGKFKEIEYQNHCKLGTHGSPRRRGSGHDPPVKALGLGDVKRYITGMHNTDNVTDNGGDHHHHQHSTTSNSIAANRGVVTIGHNTTTAPTIPHSPSTGVVTAAAVSAASNTGSTSGSRDCAGCGKRITERFLLKALDLFWHEDCLKCGCCDCRLGEVGSTLYTKANLILCKRDYLRLFGTTGYCAACNKVIPAFEMVMRAKSNVYHLECFACQVCNHRFCVGDRFYLCDNKILCEYDYEERLVFANMAYNPSSLAHIRRQVSSLQPAGDSMNCGIGGRISANNSTNRPSSAHCLNDKLQLPHPPSNIGHQHRDDGSSGYGSPDSETFESPHAQ